MSPTGRTATSWSSASTCDRARGPVLRAGAGRPVALLETAYLLRAPADGRRLPDSLDQTREGERTQPDQVGPHPHAWEDHLHWQGADRQVRCRVDRLLEDCLRHPFEGIGKPEPLRHPSADAGARRLTGKLRLVYLVDGDDLVVLQVRHHD